MKMQEPAEGYFHSKRVLWTASFGEGAAVVSLVRK